MNTRGKSQPTEFERQFWDESADADNLEYHAERSKDATIRRVAYRAERAESWGTFWFLLSCVLLLTAAILAGVIFFYSR